ncbi:lipopolysaccharide biosynthesis protein [Methylobacillus flagellatus]|uniref:lipopolysaccharide biosynthesis protein n=1 Tax=Methylobacillus flagellatus TaxID=405 RepID=UPI002853D961|nr:lipopolysaccharide biosynthesis protein [Methylobacillus flagellatus]MDR5172636.1 lipopolysaccharide biosynthesis protein [Methylobacillus flagellatus]
MSLDIVKHSKAGVLSLVSGQAARVLVQVISIVVLARLLTPADYGLTAIVVTLVGLGEIVRDFGLSSSAVQADSLNNREKSNLFWINSLIGTSLAALLFFSAPLLAAWFQDARLADIARVMSLAFLFNGLATQYKAALTRDMKFSHLAISDSLAALLSMVVGIVAAYQGMQYWAIVIQQILLSFFTLVLYVMFHRWLPAWPDIHTSVRRFITFGMHLMGSQMLGQLSRSVDTLIIGQRFGADLLGIYNRGQQLVFMALNQINAPSTTLAIPVLSKLKHDSKEYYRFLNYGQSVLMHAVSLFFGLLVLNADLVINIMLGQQWLSAIPIVQILAIAAIFQVANYSSYWIFVSKGLTRDQLIFTLVSRPVMILIIILGAVWNIYTVAAAYALALLFIWLYCYFFLSKRDIDVTALLKNSVVVCISYLLAVSLGMLSINLYDLGMIYAVIVRNLVFILALLITYKFSLTFSASADCLLKLMTSNLKKLILRK